jgi:hypothetical protein
MQTNTNVCIYCSFSPPPPFFFLSFALTTPDIAGIPPHWTKEQLEALFVQYGRLIDSRVLIGTHLLKNSLSLLFSYNVLIWPADQATGQGRGVGFVRFALRENAETAIRAVHGTTPPGCAAPLTVRVRASPRALLSACLSV